MKPLSNTSKAVRDLTIKAAKQVAREPFETLKNVPRQLAPEEERFEDQEMAASNSDDEAKKKEEEVMKQKDAQKGSSQLEALSREIEDIRRQVLFNDLLKRIKEGEQVSIDSLASLPFEQREVLKSQMEAMQNRVEEGSQEKPLFVPSSKPSRRLGGFGQKGQAEKQQTRVEKPLPPSG